MATRLIRRGFRNVDPGLPRRDDGHSDRRFSPSVAVRRIPRRSMRVVRRVSRRA